ncbi:MFS transporter [Cupriavidus consociatus]|uniref:MFS transporter n=1 Tax=Cupriavidus consociatus TaxID=2821357 RepID=UPI001AE74754|nr:MULTISPECIES: MFS transporter [unclassified Cupriavidus]MBP0619191.1 MFS transporter [Cupriavidus sp. LEh25]MDK2655837.1 MFS transporter [Cupriavidus sp. LEh21]
MTIPTTVPAAAGPLEAAGDSVYRKVAWRLVPLLFLCYIVAYLDRVNVGFAKLQMQADLQLTETVYGLGAGIFFVGYFLFEVPSNLVLHRYGARRWIARIMITWGLLSAAMMLVKSPASFYVLRFLLGAAEAGFFPGIILYLTYWFPAQRRSRVTSMFIAAIPVSGILGGPLSGWILKYMGGIAGMAGWQWMFLLQGLPTVLVGLLVLKYLDDRPAAARWLAPHERDVLARDMAAEQSHKGDTGIRPVLTSPRVWALALVYFAFVSGLYGVSFWLPSIIRGTGVADPLQIGLLSAVPWMFGVVAMYWVAASADRHLEQRWHAALAALAGAAGLVLSVAMHGNQWLAMAGLTVATMGIMATLPVFWALPTMLLGGAGAAAGIALINSFGNLSGFSAPFLVGLIHDATHSTDAGLYMLAGWLVAGAALVLLVRPTRAPLQ